MFDNSTAEPPAQRTPHASRVARVCDGWDTSRRRPHFRHPRASSIHAHRPHSMPHRMGTPYQEYAKIHTHDKCVGRGLPPHHAAASIAGDDAVTTTRVGAEQINNITPTMHVDGYSTRTRGVIVANPPTSRHVVRSAREQRGLIGSACVRRWRYCVRSTRVCGIGPGRGTCRPSARYSTRARGGSIGAQPRQAGRAAVPPAHAGSGRRCRYRHSREQKFYPPVRGIDRTQAKCAAAPRCSTRASGIDR